MARQFRIRTVLLTLALAIGGCASTTIDKPEARQANAAPDKPPVSEQSTALRQPETPYRTVVHGDTLYSIAWEAGRDYRELANWNRISPPYTIKLGQQLRVVPPVAEKTVAPPAKPAAKNKTTSAVAGKAPAPTVKSPPVVAVTPRPVSKKAKTESVKSTDSGKTGASSVTWMWPADGQMLKRYSDRDASKGLDIGGTRGQPVRATANGRVVYQGSGLRGYGQLIIVKHSDEFLSAYAHNDRIYVKEGEVVKRGQKIADMGSTGTDRVKLHFEIRRQGTPIDPLKYLPKR